MLFLDLILNAIATGIMLGMIYALYALGLTITFGILHIPNIAHPVLIVVGAYAAVIANAYGLDPIVAALLVAPLFYLAGAAFYLAYARLFEARGRGQSLPSLTLFFGVALVIEIALVLRFGADLRSVEVGYVGSSLRIGLVSLPYRLLVPALVAPAAVLALWLYLRHSPTGLAVRAVAHGDVALSICGIDPERVKRHAFGLAAATAALAGAAMVVIGPVSPVAGNAQIGRVFAIVVLAGMGSVPGTLAAGLVIGLAESFVASFGNPALAPGVSFALLLGALALRPQGLFGGVR